MLMEEGYVAVAGGRIWYRRVGDGPGIPLLLLHGGPGASSLGTGLWLGDLPHSRPVVYYDQLGGGQSERPNDPSLWTVERFVAELAQVRAALGLDEVHLLGHSWGAMLLASYLSSAPAGVHSAIFSSPCLDARQWADDQQALLAELPTKVRATIETCERTGRTDAAEYRDAMMAFYARHVLRLDPWPQLAIDLFEDINQNVYGHMWGASEWHVTGTLRDFDARPVLADLDMPVLFLCGEHDEARPATVRAHAALAPDARVHVFPDASHLTSFETPDEYRRVLVEFLSSIDT